MNTSNNSDTYSEDNSPKPSAEEESKKRRVSNACDACRQRKTKCSGQNPCNTCVAHNLACLYTYVRKKRTTYKKNSKTPTVSGSDFDLKDLSHRVEKIENSVFTMDSKLESMVNLNSQLLEKLNRVFENQQNFVSKPLRSPASSINLQKNSIIHSPRPADPMKISRFVQRETTIDKRSRKAIVDEFLKLITSSTTSTIFSLTSISWVKLVTGDHYKFFESVTEEYEGVLSQIASALNHGFNETRLPPTYLFENQEFISGLLDIFIKNCFRSSILLEFDESLTVVEQVYNKLKVADAQNPPNFSNSDYLMIFTGICHGCVYSISKMYATNVNELNSNENINAELFKNPCFKSEFIRNLEFEALKDSFFYFHKVMKKGDGEKTIFGILFLSTYLSTTAFSKCSYLTLSIACKHAQKLGLSNVLKNYSFNGKNVDREVIAKSLLWMRCYMLDRDIATNIEKPHIIKENNITDLDYVKITNLIIAQHCLTNNSDTNIENELLNNIKFDENNSIINQKIFFDFLNNFAKSSDSGFGLLVDYTSFSLLQTIGRYSKTMYLDNVLKNMNFSKDSLDSINDDEFLNSFFRAINVVDNLKEDLLNWENCLPECVKPSSESSINAYKIMKNGGINGFNNSRLKPSAKSEVIRFDVVKLLLTQINYHFNILKANKLAYTACLLFFKRVNKITNGTFMTEKEEFVKNFEAKRREFQLSFIEASKKILLLSFSMFEDFQVVYSITHYVLGAFFTIFSYILGKYNDYSEIFNHNSPIISVHDKNNSKDDHCPNEFYLLIDCYLRCLSKPTFEIRHIKSDFVEIFGRKLILILINLLKEKTNHDFDKDFKVILFLEECKRNDKDLWKIESTNYNAQNNTFDFINNKYSVCLNRDLSTSRSGNSNNNSEAGTPNGSLNSENINHKGLFTFNTNNLNKSETISRINNHSINYNDDLTKYQQQLGFSPISNTINNGSFNIDDPSIINENIFLDLADLDPFSLSVSTFNDANFSISNNYNN